MPGKSRRKPRGKQNSKVGEESEKKKGTDKGFIEKRKAKEDVEGVYHLATRSKQEVVLNEGSSTI